MKKGIDVSKWDPKMDWSKYDWDFAFIKCSEGIVIDPLFNYHWTGARGHTQRSPYHYFRAFVDPELAARRFIDYLDGDLGELPAVLDLESTNEIEIRTVVSRALTWLITYERETGITPMVYSSPSFITLLRLQDYPDFARYPFWLATYPYDNYSAGERAVIIGEILAGRKALHIPAIPKPFKTMPYFQWTAKGAPADVPGYYTGTGGKLAVDFNFQLDETEPTPEPDPDDGAGPTPEPGGTMKKAVVKIGFTLNIRSANNPTLVIGSLRGGDTVYGEIVNNRIQFSRVYRANGTVEELAGHSAVSEGSTLYMTLTDGVEPVPTPDPVPAPSVLPLDINITDTMVTVSGPSIQTVSVELRPK